MEHDYRKALALVIEEALSVARGYGINPAAFGKTSPDKTIKILRLPNFIYSVIVKVIIKIDATARSSMLADLESGRPSEIDYLQGEIVCVLGGECSHGAAVIRNILFNSYTSGEEVGIRNVSRRVYLGSFRLTTRF